MEFKFILIILSTLLSLCTAVIIRNNQLNKDTSTTRRNKDSYIRRNSDHYNSNIVQRRPGNDRVQIRVYRGPETEHDGKKFAPWGFLIRQPADD